MPFTEGGDWKIDHDDLRNRIWVCTRCGSSCNSKNPWRRSVFGAGPGGMEEAMWVNILQSMTAVRKAEAYPKRPKEEVYVTEMGRGDQFCFVGREEDICIYLDPGNQDVRDTGKPLEDTGDRLMKLFNIIRKVDEGVLASYVCDATNGHKWTDDPLEIEKVRAARKIEEDA